MKILIVYYSRYGHTLQMARAVEEGSMSVDDIEVVFRRVQEFPDVEKDISKDKYAKQAWDQQRDIPVCTLGDLEQADGLVLGTPTRYGNMAAQMKKFVDSTVELWLKGALEGKPVGFFVSTATTHGGQESTLLTMMVPFLHLGMLIVGVPYSTPGMLHTEGRGGTPYGATTVAGPKNDLQPTIEDLSIARTLGRRIAELAKKIKYGMNS